MTAGPLPPDLLTVLLLGAPEPRVLAAYAGALHALLTELSAPARDTCCTEFADTVRLAAQLVSDAALYGAQPLSVAALLASVADEAAAANGRAAAGLRALGTLLFVFDGRVRRLVCAKHRFHAPGALGTRPVALERASAFVTYVRGECRQFADDLQDPVLVADVPRFHTLVDAFVDYAQRAWLYGLALPWPPANDPDAYADVEQQQQQEDAALSAEDF